MHDINPIGGHYRRGHGWTGGRRIARAHGHQNQTFRSQREDRRVLCDDRFEAAQRAGVRRIVHVSITNPAEDSPLEYFSGKARLERALIESGLSYAILRPTVLFGKGLRRVRRRQLPAAAGLRG